MTASKNTPASAPIEDEWEIAAEARTKMSFDTDGDVWEGFFEGFETIIDPNTGEEYQYINFRDAAGDGYTTSANYQLSRAFGRISQGTYCRIIRLSETKVAKGNMINFKVLTRRGQNP
jgi:hypothetical protein